MHLAMGAPGRRSPNWLLRALNFCNAARLRAPARHQSALSSRPTRSRWLGYQGSLLVRAVFFFSFAHVLVFALRILASTSPIYISNGDHVRHSDPPVLYEEGLISTSYTCGPLAPNISQLLRWHPQKALLRGSNSHITFKMLICLLRMVLRETLMGSSTGPRIVGGTLETGQWFGNTRTRV